MAEIINAVSRCEPVEGTDRIRVDLESGKARHSYELAPAAVDNLFAGVLATPRVPGRSSVPANALTPVGCVPFETLQGLCGLAFSLGDRDLYIGVPPTGIAHVRRALDAIEEVYRKAGTAVPKAP
jgi:hypothetical protein